MDDRESLQAAEARMNAARDKLLTYVEGRKTLLGDEYRRLVAVFKKAEAEFLRATARLGG